MTVIIILIYGYINCFTIIWLTLIHYKHDYEWKWPYCKISNEREPHPELHWIPNILGFLVVQCCGLWLSYKYTTQYYTIIPNFGIKIINWYKIYIFGFQTWVKNADYNHCHVIYFSGQRTCVDILSACKKVWKNLISGKNDIFQLTNVSHDFSLSFLVIFVKRWFLSELRKRYFYQTSIQCTVFE